MSRLYLIAFFITFSSVSFSQQKLKQYLNFAYKKYQQGDYVYAIEYYQKAMELDSNDIQTLWQYAEVLRAYKDYPKAAFYYGKVYDREHAELYPYSLLNYGLMLKQCGRYKEAIEVFKRCRKKYRRMDPRGYLYRKSRREVQSCIWANANKGDSTLMVFEKLPHHISTPNAEFGHRVHKGKLLFSSLRADSISTSEEVYDTTYHTHLYQSKINDSTFEKPKKIKSINWKDANTGNGTYSLDGKRFYFSYCKNNDYNYKCKILVAYVNGNQLEAVDTLGEIINHKEANTTMPFIGKWNGKEVLFFASDREGGKGKMDIWYSFIRNGNQFQRPINVRRINSMDNELSPYWDSSSTILYFSSSWYNGFGGYDVFKSNYNTHFEEPENLLKPVNSPANDLYYFQTSTKDTALFSSNRIGSNYSKNPTCCSDIFLVRKKFIDSVPTITESLEELNERLPVTLYFHNDRPNPNSWDTTSNVNYIAAYDTYINRIKTYKNKYAEGLHGEEAIDAKDDIEDFFMQYVKQGVKDLQQFRDLLLIELDRGRIIEITVKGFASPLAKTEYNVNLTKRRIASLVNYLKEYDDGIFVKYFNGTAKNNGKLLIKQAPFGEYQANQIVSDNPNDAKHSIYSRSAAIERKIQIQSVDIIRKGDIETTVLSADNLVFDAGITPKGTVLSHTFTITNSGQNKVKIDSIVPSNEQITHSINKRELNPGESTTITMQFNTEGIIGHNVAFITIFYNGLEKGLKISIASELK